LELELFGAGAAIIMMAPREAGAAQKSSGPTSHKNVVKLCC